jgi:hypothetical protein
MEVEKLTVKVEYGPWAVQVGAVLICREAAFTKQQNEREIW